MPPRKANPEKATRKRTTNRKVAKTKAKNEAIRQQSAGVASGTRKKSTTKKSPANIVGQPDKNKVNQPENRRTKNHAVQDSLPAAKKQPPANVKKTPVKRSTPKTQEEPKDEPAIRLLRELKEKLDSRKAEDIVLLDLREASGYLDYFLLVTALSVLHIKNLANETDDLMRAAGYRPFNNILADVESGWQVLDYGEIVVHIFTAEKRAFYNLEKTWEKAKRI